MNTALGEAPPSSPDTQEKKKTVGEKQKKEPKRHQTSRCHVLWEK